MFCRPALQGPGVGFGWSAACARGGCHTRPVRGGAGFRGRGMPLPYMPSGHDRPNGIAAAARANVGRDALIPPHPAAARGSAGGMNPAPTGIFFVSGKPEVRGRAGRADMESAPTWGVCGGVNVLGFEFQRWCGGRERPPYGAGETRRPPGKMQFPRPLQTHVGDDARIVPGCSRRRGVREGHAPPLHGIRARPAKWDCRGHPGERRAGCPHPAAPRGRAGFRGWDKSRPTGKFCVPGKPGGRNVCPGL